MMALTILLAALVGVALGLLGGGGSILTVPLLAYVAGLDAKHAIATSLLVVSVTGAVGAIAHARAGRVQWRTGVLVGLAGMAGAYAGGRVAQWIPGTVLMVAFAVIMIATATAMLLGRTATGGTGAYRHLPLRTIALLGLAVGMISGLVGAGGGFLLVPALAVLGGLPMPTAVGTSLVVIAMQSSAGLFGHLESEHLDWRLAGMVTAAAVVGTLIGGRLTPMFDPGTLRKLFGWFVLLMASVILAQETHPAIGVAAAAATVAAAAFYLICSRMTRCPLRPFVGHPHSPPSEADTVTRRGRRTAIRTTISGAARAEVCKPNVYRQLSLSWPWSTTRNHPAALPRLVIAAMVGATSIAVAAAPSASAAPNEPPCSDMGGSTQCQSPGNVQIYTAPHAMPGTANSTYGPFVGYNHGRN